LEEIKPMNDKDLERTSHLFMIDRQLVELNIPPSTSVFLTSTPSINGQDHKFDVICKQWFIIYN